MQKKLKKAFTLVEILVVISLIILIVLWINSINFNKLSNEQEAEIFSNKIVSIIEELRDDSITWKWKTSSTWITPIKERILEIKSWENFSIKSYFIEINKTEETPFREIKKSKKEKIETIKCGGVNPDIKITFTWNKINFDKTCSVLEICVDFNSSKNKIKFDRVSGLVSQEKTKTCN